jgi:hypothetical protein
MRIDHESLLPDQPWKLPSALVLLKVIEVSSAGGLSSNETMLPAPFLKHSGREGCTDGLLPIACVDVTEAACVPVKSGGEASDNVLPLPILCCTASVVER